MIILFVIIAALGLFFGGTIGHIAPLCFASLYVLVMAHGAFFGGTELDKSTLARRLEDSWYRSDEIAQFITKYWYSIKYVRSAQKRGGNASALGAGSLLISGWYFFADTSTWMAAWSLVNGLLLWAIGNKVNKALYILNYEQQSPIWDTACASFLALSELLPDPIYAKFVSEQMPKERVSDVIRGYRKSD